MTRRNWTIACAGAAAAALLFLLVFFLPALGKLWQLKQDISTQLEKNRQADEKTELSGDLVSSFRIAKQKLETCRARIPHRSRKLDVLHSIEEMSQKIGDLQAVSLRMLSSSKVTDDTAQTQLFDVKFEGDYEEISTFLHELTHMANMITVESLAIAPAKEKKLKAHATVACYLANRPDFTGTESIDQ
jgi:Tfp pilus assembly protein PilO